MITLTTPPVLRPYSAWYPPVLTSTSWMNSVLMFLPWKPLMTLVVLTPSIRNRFSAERRAVDRERERASLRLAAVRLHARLRQHDRRVIAPDRQLVDDLGRVVGARSWWMPTSTSGASPVTVIASFVASCICMLTVAVASSVTVAVLLDVPNPDRFAVTLYCPGRQADETVAARRCPSSRSACPEGWDS